MRTESCLNVLAAAQFDTAILRVNWPIFAHPTKPTVKTLRTPQLLVGLTPDRDQYLPKHLVMELGVGLPQV